MHSKIKNELSIILKTFRLYRRYRFVDISEILEKTKRDTSYYIMNFI